MGTNLNGTCTSLEPPVCLFSIWHLSGLLSSDFKFNFTRFKHFQLFLHLHTYHKLFNCGHRAWCKFSSSTVNFAQIDLDFVAFANVANVVKGYTTCCVAKPASPSFLSTCFKPLTQASLISLLGAIRSRVLCFSPMTTEKQCSSCARWDRVRDHDKQIPLLHDPSLESHLWDPSNEKLSSPKKPGII